MNKYPYHEDDAVSSLINIFNNIFKKSHKTILVRGKEEPIYLPISKACEFNQVIFAHGSFASALHEISHWLIAGRDRRTLVDYGYWYVPDRGSTMQEEFLKAEVRPQALEMLLTLACGRPFFLSADNVKPGGTEIGPEWSIFKKNVLNQARKMALGELPPRTQLLLPDLFQTFHKKKRASTNHQESWDECVLTQLVRLEQTLDF